MPEVVEADLRQSRTLGDAVEIASPDVVLMQRFPVGLTEHEVPILVPLSRE